MSGFGPLTPGDVISVRTGGGGGWGNPRDRDPERVLADVRDELIDRATAEETYGVAMTLDASGTLSIDTARTRQLRGDSRSAGPSAGSAWRCGGQPHFWTAGTANSAKRQD